MRWLMRLSAACNRRAMHADAHCGFAPNYPVSAEDNNHASNKRAHFPRAGIALRVPTPNVSVVDLVIQVEKKTFAEEVNNAFREAAAGAQKGVLAVSDLPLVSRDFALSNVSTTIDSSLTMVMVRSRVSDEGFWTPAGSWRHCCPVF